MMSSKGVDKKAAKSGLKSIAADSYEMSQLIVSQYLDEHIGTGILIKCVLKMIFKAFICFESFYVLSFLITFYILLLLFDDY
uniref:Uncharacterized protein n=1 Tax=Glossina pallidipes TaxID=7398 RepID=A0A1B0AJF5_GLOPL